MYLIALNRAGTPFFNKWVQGFIRSKTFLVMKLTIVFALIALQVSAAGYGQRVSISGEKMTLKKVFNELKKQSDYTFFYSDKDLAKANKVSIDAHNAELLQVLNTVFTNQPLVFNIIDKVVVVKEKLSIDKDEYIVVAVKPVFIEITGSIVDEEGNPIDGASIIVEGSKTGTSTNAKGFFSINANPGQTLHISAVGYETQQHKVSANSTVIKITLKKAEKKENEVIVVNTGQFARKKESFTGAVTTFSGNELRTVSNMNVIQSLKSLDPSFLVIENNLQGSNPNALPTIELRGKTSLSGATLKNEFTEDPNQPLFILDGFPASLQRITDLDINRIESVTLLKDAASTAIYGARAANGVVVVETVKPKPGQLNVNYSADFMAQMPDLSDYNLMNAAEKLEFEKLAGRYTLYTTVLPEQQFELDQVYNNKLQEVQRGVNTYWMNEPLRTAITNGHSIQVSGGSKEFMFNVGGNYRSFPGVMKGSDRNTYGGNVDVTYRSGKFNFSNRFNLSGTESNESPYGSFSNYSRANPYYRKYNEDGSIPKLSESSPNTTLGTYFVYNPLYDAQFNNINNTKGNQFQNQLSMVFTPSIEWRFSASTNISKGNTTNKNFAPPERTQFDQVDIFKKGSYTRTNNQSNTFQLNIQAAYAKVIEKNQLNINAQAEVESKNNFRENYSTVGFPAGSNGNPVFSFGYPESARPDYANAISRRNNLLLAVNYSYDQTYFADLTGRMDGSTAFGSARKYTPFWSAGIGWNMYKNVFKNVNWMNLLRLKASVGYTGNQNIGSTSSTSTYTFEQSVNYFGQGMSLTSLGNDDLRWQKTFTTNISIDYGLLNNRINGYLNVYQKKTDPLVVVLDLPASTGVYGYGMNAGMMNTKGIEYNVKYSPIYRLKDRVIWTIGINGASLKSKYDKFGSTLAGLDKKLQDSKSLTRYRDGYSPDDIWAVQSLGIDPATGKEIFLKLNGQQSFDYSTDDIQRIGNQRPRFEGVISNSFGYKGFTMSFYLRYKFGGDLFNTALWQKVENISIDGLKQNQDKRALYDRWQKPGDIALFKAISSTSTTPASSRFIQKNNMLVGESINIGWQFNEMYNPWIKKLYLKNMGVSLYANDIFRWATTLNERGIDYPFSRNVSLKISASF